jgi:hypothetical protein
LRSLALFAVSGLLLSGCASVEPKLDSETPSPTPSEQAKSATASPEPSATEPTEAELAALIRATPENKDLRSLAAHIETIDNAAGTLEPFEIDYQIGPTADPVKVKTVVDRFSEKLKIFQLLGLDSLDQDWVLVSEQDYEWWAQYRASQDADFPLALWDQDRNELGHCGLSSDVFCGAGNLVNGVNYQDNVVGTRFTDRGLDYVSRHEAAHFYQAVFGYGGKCWMAEGQATFFEAYLEPSSRSRSQVVQSLLSSPTGVAKSSEAELFELIDSNMVCEGDSNIAYDMGMLAFEYLYMNFSLLQIHDLLVFSSDSSWEASVREALSVEAEQLNRDLASYIFIQVN